MAVTVPLSPISEHLRDDFLQLSKRSLEHVGVATQTLGAIYRLAGENRETFASRRVIADLSCRPLRCVANDLKKLCDARLLVNRGRKRFSGKTKKVRRTSTLMLTAAADEHWRPYLQVPRWSLERLPNWSSRIVFAAIVTRHLLIENLEIENEHGRESYSIESLARDTGLSVRSVQDAKARLAAAGFIVVDVGGTSRDDHGRLLSSADEPRLNLDLKLPIPEQPKPTGKCGTPVKGSATPHRPAEVAHTPSKSGTRGGAEVAHTPSKTCTRNEVTLLRTSITNTETKHVNGAAEPASVDVVRFDRSLLDEEKLEQCKSNRPDNETLDSELAGRQKAFLELMGILDDANDCSPSTTATKPSGSPASQESSAATGS